jgi:hypothetical protein
MDIGLFFAESIWKMAVYIHHVVQKSTHFNAFSIPDRVTQKSSLAISFAAPARTTRFHGLDIVAKGILSDDFIIASVNRVESFFCQSLQHFKL